MLEVKLLGQFDLRQDGKAVSLQSRPAQSLLAYLILHHGIEHRREKLAGLFWPEASESNARSSLRHALWRIRKAIGPDYLLTDKFTVTFDSNSDYWLDASVMEAEPGVDAAPEELMDVVTVYGGELLPGFYDEWVSLERERLQAVFERRMKGLLNRLIDLTLWDDLLQWGENWIAMGQVPEPAYQAMMLAHAGLGDLAGVAAVYQRCIEALEEELGVEPSEKTQTLYKELSTGKLPEATSTEDISQPRISPSRQIRRPAKEDLPPFLDENVERLREHEEIFIGRERELADLEAHLAQVTGGHGHIVFVTGEAGRGKTTLLREFSQRVQDRHTGVITASGACPVYTPVCAPYGLFREVLEMLTGDVETAWAAGTINRDLAIELWRSIPETVDIMLQRGPNLVDSLISGKSLMGRAESAGVGQDQLNHLATLMKRAEEGGQLTDQGALFAEFADVLVVLSERRPLLLVLDDLHWADPSSIGLLGHLGHRLRESAILLVGAYRPEELSQGREGETHPLVPVLTEYKRRFGDLRLVLDDAEAERGIHAGRTFIDALLDTEANDLDETFRQALARHTEGHPLFTVELLREMQERGALRQNEAGRWIVGPEFNWDLMPPRVEGVIETRINRLPTELREWLVVASVEGETFTAEVIAQAFGVDKREVVKRLSGEIDRQHRLVAAEGIHRIGAIRLSRYRFRHNLFRQYLYAQLDDIERSYLHEQVGRALEQLYRQRSSEIVDQLAHHFQMAGEAEKAVPYLIQAGDLAARAYANEEAIGLYEQALAFAREGAFPEEELMLLYTNLGRTLEHQAQIDRALAVYEELESLAQEKGNRRMELAALIPQATLYAIPSPVHDPGRGELISERALAVASELDDREAEAKIHWNLILVYEYSNRLSKAIVSGERSLKIARELKLDNQLGKILSDLADCYWLGGQMAQTRELFEEAVVLRRQGKNQHMLADVLFSYSLATMFAGDYDQAIALVEEARQISQTINNPWGMAYSPSKIGFVYRERGQLDRAISLCEKSIELAEEFGFQFPKMAAGNELAFTYASIGNVDRGFDNARRTLNLAMDSFPSFNPYALAALAQIQLSDGDLNGATSTIRKAKRDSYWQAFPAYCQVIDLTEGQIALKKGNHYKASKVAETLGTTLQQSGFRSYLPAALDLQGQALLGLGQPEAARGCFLEARKIADELQANMRLWPILFHLSQVEPDPEEAGRLRAEAIQVIESIADRIPSEELRESFLSLPEASALIEIGDKSV